jgi:hypothetical protein
MVNNGPDIKVLTETGAAVETKQRENVATLEKKLQESKTEKKIATKLEESTNEVLKNVKDNLINSFFDKETNAINSIDAFKKAYNELNTNIRDQYDISKNETFKALDRIIKV